jgi:hypothetical protein
MSMTSAAVWDAASLGQKCMQFGDEVKASRTGRVHGAGTQILGQALGWDHGRHE